MKKRILLLAAFPYLLLSSVKADDASHASNLVRGEVIKASQMDKAFEGAKSMMQQMAVNQAKQMGSGTKEESEKMEAMQKEIFEMSMNESKAMLTKMDKVYADTFSEEELQGMKQFFESKSGKAMIEKQPKLMQKMMPLIVDMQANMKPKLDAIIKKYKNADAAKQKN